MGNEKGMDVEGAKNFINRMIDEKSKDTNAFYDSMGSHLLALPTRNMEKVQVCNDGIEPIIELAKQKGLAISDNTAKTAMYDLCIEKPNATPILPTHKGNRLL